MLLLSLALAGMHLGTRLQVPLWQTELALEFSWNWKHKFSTVYGAEKTLYLSETLDCNGEVVADSGAAGPVRHEAVGGVGHHARSC